VSDYFTRLEEQLGQLIEAGAHDRRRTARLPRSRPVVLAAAASILIAVAVVAVALGTAGGGTVRSTHGTVPVAGNSPGRAGYPAVAQRPRVATHTTARQAHAVARPLRNTKTPVDTEDPKYRYRDSNPTGGD
jgi:hypothetical protein